jgi:hypothetical protein
MAAGDVSHNGQKYTATGELYVTGTTTGLSDYPSGATAVRATSGSVAATAAVATMAAVADKTNYVTGFEITSGGATAASLVVAVLSGLLGGSMSYIQPVVAGATLGNPSIIVQFTKAIPASAVNIAIVLTLPSLGVGNTAACVNLHGYTL